MKILRNVAFVLVALAWVTSHPKAVLAGGGGGACSIACDWSGSCCDVSINGFDCNSLCGFCDQGSGESTDTDCSADVGGDNYPGTICQCESPFLP
jgi:hypothetical protein